MVKNVEPSESPKTVLIYGANGFSGRSLISRLLQQKRLALVVAGRNHDELIAIGHKYALETRIFNLQKPKHIQDQLQGIDLVLNCAGTFQKTTRPLLEACAACGVHYVDLSGELHSVRYVFKNQKIWENKKIRVVPALGFTTLATEALIAKGKRQFPGASTASVFMRPRNVKISLGTTLSLVEVLRNGSLERKDGRLKSVEFGSQDLLSPFRHTGEIAMSFPSADLVTAWVASKIPQIRSFLVLPLWQVRLMRYLKVLQVFLFLASLRKILAHIMRFVTLRQSLWRSSLWGMNNQEQAPEMQLWIELGRQPHPGRYIARAKTKDPYQFTYQVVPGLLERIAFGNTPYAVGAMSASVLVDDEFIEQSGAWFEIEEEFDLGIPDDGE